MACNKILGAGKDLIDAPVMDLTFTLSQAELALFNRDAYDLMMDVEILVDMVKVGPIFSSLLVNLLLQVGYEPEQFA